MVSVAVSRAKRAKTSEQAPAPASANPIPAAVTRPVDWSRCMWALWRPCTTLRLRAPHSRSSGRSNPDRFACGGPCAAQRRRSSRGAEVLLAHELRRRRTRTSPRGEVGRLLDGDQHDHEAGMARVQSARPSRCRPCQASARRAARGPAPAPSTASERVRAGGRLADELEVARWRRSPRGRPAGTPPGRPPPARRSARSGRGHEASARRVAAGLPPLRVRGGRPDRYAATPWPPSRGGRPGARARRPWRATTSARCRRTC